MSNSFVAELRKLADQAAEEKSREEAKARAEQLRVKREAAVVARTLARQARKEQRKKEQEAEEERQRKLAEDAERKQRIREEKAQQAIKEKQRKEEVERVRRHQLKLYKLCREIYIDLAVAAWDGNREVRVDGDVADFDEDLLQFGIEIQRPQKLATALNRAMIDLVASMEALSKAADGIAFNQASRSLTFWSMGLRHAGHEGIGVPFADLLARIQLEIPDNMQSILRRRAHAVATISSLEERNGRTREEIRTLHDSIEAALIAQEKRESAYGDAVANIRDHIQDIGSAFLGNLPHGLVPKNLSFEERAAALRTAYSTFIPNRQFASYTNLEIVNLMRMANRLKPIRFDNSGLDSEQGWRTLKEDDEEQDEIYFHPKLLLLNSNLSKADDKIKNLKVDISSLDGKKRSMNGLQKKVEECQADVAKFEKILASNLENVESKDLRFMDGQYVAPTLAKLGDACPEDSLGISSAHRELTWLYGESGKDFCGYLDIVLAELAKEGARSVALSFFESEDGGKVEVGTVSLVCSIGHPLLGVLFAKRGFNFEVASASAPPVSMKLSW